MTLARTMGALAGATGLLAVLAAPRAYAATATADLAVSATVSNNCTISTAPLAFGSYDPVDTHSAANLNGTGTVIVACTKNVAPTIALGLGNNANGATRRLTDGTNFLTYQLYKDAARTQVWGDAVGDVLSPGAAPSKAPRNLTVYGAVTSNQDVPAGSYADTVVATVDF
jgi:spore coat protein U-like protein